MNYKMILAYDGSRYRGWQIQKNTEDTIQGKLTHVLSSIAGEEVEVQGSGRTDAGVHAKGQVVSFQMASPVKLMGSCQGKDGMDLLLERVNSFLPEDIAALSLEGAPARFHARLSAKSKTYRYRIHTGAASNVFERKYLYTYRDKPLDVERMRQAAQGLLGTHDFASFCGNKHRKKSTVRTITSIDIRQKEGEITIDYRGDGFLQNMVRILTGTLIEVGNGSREPETMGAILEGKNRELAGYTAPAQGLCLMQVEY